MGEERPVRVFRNGRSKAVRIPKEFEFPGDEATWRKADDGTLVLKPKRTRGLLALLDSWEPLGEDEQFPEIEDLPPKPFTLFDDL
jgi:antitoxin VapB